MEWCSESCYLREFHPKNDSQPLLFDFDNGRRVVEARGGQAGWWVVVEYEQRSKSRFVRAEAALLCNFGGCGGLDHKTRFAVRRSKSCAVGGSIGLSKSSSPKA